MNLWLSLHCLFFVLSGFNDWLLSLLHFLLHFWTQSYVDALFAVQHIHGNLVCKVIFDNIVQYVQSFVYWHLLD